MKITLTVHLVMHHPGRPPARLLAMERIQTPAGSFTYVEVAGQEDGHASPNPRTILSGE